MSNKMNTDSRWVRLVVVACMVTICLACSIITFASMVFIDTTKCGAVSRALPVLWITIAVVFLASVVVVGVKARKIIPVVAGRRAIVAVYGVVMLVSYVVIAFLLMVAFNC
jgi:hypothetical protein